MLYSASRSIHKASRRPQPVILYPDEYAAWIDRDITNPAGQMHPFQPYPTDLMEMWPVSPLVNSVRKESADLVMPIHKPSTLNLDMTPRLL
jgi:putative SOS response-associated peptidase YedK